MKKQTKIAMAILTGITILAITPFLLKSPIEHWIAGLHQQGITRELATLEQEDSKVTNWNTAVNAIDTMRGAQHYYVPGVGYRSNAEIEGALAAQRQKTLEAIGHGLETYIGEHFGTDIDKWEKWRAEKTVSPKQ